MILNEKRRPQNVLLRIPNVCSWKRKIYAEENLEDAPKWRQSMVNLSVCCSGLSEVEESNSYNKK